MKASNELDFVLWHNVLIYLKKELIVPKKKYMYNVVSKHMCTSVPCSPCQNSKSSATTAL